MNWKGEEFMEVANSFSSEETQQQLSKLLGDRNIVEFRKEVLDYFMRVKKLTYAFFMHVIREICLRALSIILYTFGWIWSKGGNLVYASHRLLQSSQWLLYFQEASLYLLNEGWLREKKGEVIGAIWKYFGDDKISKKHPIQPLENHRMRWELLKGIGMRIYSDPKEVSKSFILIHANMITIRIGITFMFKVIHIRIGITFMFKVTPIRIGITFLTPTGEYSLPSRDVYFISLRCTCL